MPSSGSESRSTTGSPIGSALASSVSAAASCVLLESPEHETTPASAVRTASRRNIGGAWSWASAVASEAPSPTKCPRPMSRRFVRSDLAIPNTRTLVRTRRRRTIGSSAQCREADRGCSTLLRPARDARSVVGMKLFEQRRIVCGLRMSSTMAVRQSGTPRTNPVSSNELGTRPPRRLRPNRRTPSRRSDTKQSGAVPTDQNRRERPTAQSRSS